MSILIKIKTPLGLFIHIISYATFILSIIQITLYRDMYGHTAYVPPVAAICTVAALQMVYLVAFWAFRRRPAYSIAKMLAAMSFLACFNLGAVIALTVQRHDFCTLTPHGHYVTGGAYTRGDCQGVIRGMMGLGWALFGADLVYMAFLGVLSRYGMSTPVGKAGVPVKVEDAEKNPFR
ncbi:hypothetical protein CcaverHIS002_0212590 [Cutaneotrichosporon cavernicola]|uniref:Uncharacterized protein n=1 Tax=Cutaneotrichosporon cavernicola TaxID=279322 RepID=A0AA48IBR6_9TREE|nr:uncharacterized protein CcaverHIS019_0212590 [Cutaneotrichosporon cavernicola]BEI82099.1 hypothetical protein CcaverHIS002_0212590 [Cutaneotrichosporon cavernicola]BEI89897.1 hypothetical protein CcaverHIS019_0212590 [Cutaneotrichosporon cavernicola]BEI97668.1 hypothetical protein CcaverHIS631_0212570 [Cutaneotrichosporon cavernicola]BEJ05445.1 hypothetical protein CcaverHIS641_0212620 [Cutaneotrichosporon cavernicola]